MAARSWPLLLRGQGSFRVGATDFWDTVIERHPIDVVDLGSKLLFAASWMNVCSKILAGLHAQIRHLTLSKGRQIAVK